MMAQWVYLELTSLSAADEEQDLSNPYRENKE